MHTHQKLSSFSKLLHPCPVNYQPKALTEAQCQWPWSPLYQPREPLPKFQWGHWGHGKQLWLWVPVASALTLLKRWPLLVSHRYAAMLVGLQGDTLLHYGKGVTVVVYYGTSSGAALWSHSSTEDFTCFSNQIIGYTWTNTYLSYSIFAEGRHDHEPVLPHRC